jgi:hypothetical protein
MLWRRCGAGARGRLEGARVAYLSQLGNVLPVDSAVAVVAGEIIALIPEAPTPPRRSRRLAESRQERLARCRFDRRNLFRALVRAGQRAKELEAGLAACWLVTLFVWRGRTRGR